MKRVLLLFVLLVPALFAADLLVVDRPLVHRVSLQKTPTRGIAVGYPEQFNAVLDSVSFTPLYVWNGGFLNLDGELRGRGGRVCRILGPRIDLQLPKAPLRFGNAQEMPRTIVFKGYERKGYEPPVFFAEVDGHRVGLRIVQKTRNHVTFSFDLPAKRDAVFFAVDGLNKSEVLPGPELTWSADKKSLVVPDGVDAFTVSLDLSGRQGVVQKKEKVTGKSLYQQYCSACHALDDHKLIGPSFNGLWGKKETVLANGSPREITVDAAYIRRAILEPQAEVVEGYEAVVMPPFKGILSEEEIELLVQFLQEKDRQ